MDGGIRFELSLTDELLDRSLEAGFFVVVAGGTARGFPFSATGTRLAAFFHFS